MKQRNAELRFIAVDNTNVIDPLRLDQGVRYVVGKRYDEEQDADVLDADRGRIVLTKPQLAQLRPYYAKCVRAGELRCADKATADILGVPFVAPPQGRVTE